MSFLEINEEWIKDRVKITNEKLDDIKSLSLPGTYDEKIFKLGHSLIHFTRLKELDLSRNILESLEGIEHLRCLESLNLYYNNIGSLKELYRLRGNANLAQLDLRLNPVARNEADYRLCLIHMLPLLIRLDDRCVKDQERKAALMYFGSDQSREFSTDSSTRREDADRSCLTLPPKKTHPRVEMVNRWTKGIVKEDFFDKAHNDSENFHLNLNGIESEDLDNITAPRLKDLRSVKEYSHKDYISAGDKRLSVERELTNGKPSSLRQNRYRGNYSTVPVYVRQDELTSENENRDKAHGDDARLLGLEERPPVSRSANCTPPITYSQTQSSNHRNELDNELVLPREMTDRICDLVDRYWNGSHSLHQNQKFIIAVGHTFYNYFPKSADNSNSKSEINYLKENLFRLEEENITLKENRSEMKSFNRSSDKNDIEDIRRTNRALKDEIGELRHKLEASEKMSEITDLLKQSHDSLITTNEQLKRQLIQQNKPVKSKGY